MRRRASSHGQTLNTGLMHRAVFSEIQLCTLESTCRVLRRDRNVRVPTETQSCGFTPTPFRPCSRAAQAESRASSVRARAVAFVCMSPLRAGCPSDVPTSGTGRARLGGWRGEAVSPRRPARCLRTGGEPQTTGGGVGTS